MKRLAPFVLGLAVGGIVGFLVGDSRPKAGLPRAAAPALADDARTERTALPTEALRRIPSEDNEPRETLPARDHPSAPAEPAAATGQASIGALRVKALDAAGEPLPRVSVTLHLSGQKSKEEKQKEADAEGIALFPNLTPGMWRVFVFQGGENCEDDAEVRAGETTEIVLEFTKGLASIEGTVRSRNGEPLADVYVGASILLDGVSRRFSTKTDKEGHYRLEKLPAGKCLVSASVKIDGSFRTLMEWIQLAAGAVVYKDFQEGAVSLFGSVREAGTGAPIADVSVRAQSPMSGSAKTDEHGQWQLLNLMTGDYTIVVSKDGYGIEFLRRIEVGGAGRCLDIELRPAADLVLTVTGPDGRPYQGRMYVGFQSAVEGEGTRVGTSVTTDENGRAIYRQALPGVYETISFRAEGVGAVAHRQVKLSEGTNVLRVELR